MFQFLHYYEPGVDWICYNVNLYLAVCDAMIEFVYNRAEESIVMLWSTEVWFTVTKIYLVDLKTVLTLKKNQD